MNRGMSAEHGERTISEWLELVAQGDIQLPSFQREYIWNDDQSIRDYVLAVLRNRFTGLLLTLQTDGQPMFPCRRLDREDDDGKAPKELLLDGQQRLTTLWRILNGRRLRREHYIRVADRDARRLEIEDVVSYSPADGAELRDAKCAWGVGLVPLHVLGAADTPETDAIWRWANDALSDKYAAHLLETRLSATRDEILGQRLHFCRLPPTTTEAEAVTTFIQANRSSVKVSEVDIAIAVAQHVADLDLRQQIENHCKSDSAIRSHFETRYRIARVSERLLMGACLWTGKSPKRTEFSSAVRQLAQEDWAGELSLQRQVAKLLDEISEVVEELARTYGCPTERFVAAAPAFHVLVGLRRLPRPSRPPHRDQWRKLISSYVWRAFFTDRYDSQANQKLVDDYKALVQCHAAIVADQPVAPLLPAPFKLQPLTAADLLSLDGKWFLKNTRASKALPALILNGRPPDWVEGEPIDANMVRARLPKNLDRHHVFPRALFGTGSQKRVDHPLNGVILSKESNLMLGRDEPAEYVARIVSDKDGPDETELRSRVEEHLIPWNQLIDQGGRVRTRYERFLEARAELVADRIQEVCTFSA